MANIKRSFESGGSLVGLLAIIGTVVGVIAILFGILWITVIFANFEKVPTDFERTVELTGDYTVVDEAFTDQLQANTTLTGLLASGAAGDLLGSLAVQQLLASPTVAQVVSNPQLLGILQDPAALAALSNPAVASLLSNALLVGMLSDPSLLAALADPAALPALLSDPTIAAVLGPVLADPTILALLTDPGILALLGSGALGAITSSPGVVELLQNPVFGSVLANEAAQALLADPAALALALDPRAMQILANPASLPTLEFPVKLHRERKDTDTDGDKLFMNEQITTTDPGSGATIPGFEKTDANVVVHRESKLYLEGPEHTRTGYWGVPFHVDKSKTYNAYLTVARQPLPAVYQATEEVNGLETYRFMVDVTNQPMGVDDPAGTGLPLVVDAQVTVWVEPSTGAAVDAIDIETISAFHEASGAKFVRFSANMSYTDATVSALVGEAEDDKSTLFRFGRLLPGLFIFFGIALAVGGGITIVMGRRQKGAAEPTASAEA